MFTSSLRVDRALVRRVRLGSPFGDAGRVSRTGIADKIVPQNCFSPRTSEEGVDSLEERAIELRQLKQPRYLDDLRESHVYLQDSRNRLKDRQASRNRHESSGVGDEHVLAGTGDEEEVLHSANRNATGQDCPRADDVAAANQTQARDPGNWDRLLSGRRDRLDRGCGERLGRRGWARCDGKRLNRGGRKRLDRGRRDWNRRGRFWNLDRWIGAGWRLAERNFSCR